MSWIKRNCFVVIGRRRRRHPAGLAGYYLYAQWGVKDHNSEELEKSYGAVTRIAGLQPNPGNDKWTTSRSRRNIGMNVRQVIDRTTGFSSQFSLCRRAPMSARRILEARS